MKHARELLELLGAHDSMYGTDWLRLTSNVLMILAATAFAVGITLAFLAL